MRQTEILEQINQGQDVLNKMILKLNHEDRSKLKNFLEWVQDVEEGTIVDGMLELLKNSPDLASVESFIKEDKIVQAVKEYKRLMGTDLKTSYEAVKDLAISKGYEWTRA